MHLYYILSLKFSIDALNSYQSAGNPDEGVGELVVEEDCGANGEVPPIDEGREEKGDAFVPEEDCGGKGELPGEVPGAVLGLVWFAAGFCESPPSPGL